MMPPWLADAWRVLAEGLAQGRVHHALLLAAPGGFGKRALAEAFAAAALCERREADGRACGRCRSCMLVAAGSHPDRVRVGLELRDDGKPRTDITIDAMRALGQRLALASQFGGWQVALIDPADRMNASAANALLKTLEEPSRDTVIVLVADDPARLPATIRSRCHKLGLRSPEPAEAQRWLRDQGVDAATATAALAASFGNPGRALEWVRSHGLALRTACAEDIAALADGRRSTLALAEAWSADRPAERLWFAAALAHEAARRLAEGRPNAFGLTSRSEIPKLAAWSARANGVRAWLDTTLRIDLLLLDLFDAWPSPLPAPPRRAAG